MRIWALGVPASSGRVVASRIYAFIGRQRGIIAQLRHLAPAGDFGTGDGLQRGVLGGAMAFVRGQRGYAERFPDAALLLGASRSAWLGLRMH